MNNKLIMVEGSTSLARNPDTGGIVNINKDEIQKARALKQKRREEKSEFQELKNEVSELKELLNKLVERL